MKLSICFYKPPCPLSVVSGTEPILTSSWRGGSGLTLGLPTPLPLAEITAAVAFAAALIPTALELQINNSLGIDCKRNAKILHSKLYNKLVYINNYVISLCNS